MTKGTTVAAAVLVLLTTALVAVSARGGYSARLRVCADPNNLPFSNDRGEGFENRLAEMVAADLKASVEYYWSAQRRAFVRNTLQAGECDVIMGVPADFERVRTTRPYYRSSYVFLYRRAGAARVASFDDPALRSLRIGVHVIGDDAANTPPAHALSNRGIVANLVGYSIFGNYAEPNPPARLVEGVARGEVDVAVVWGPFAGYFAPRQQPPLELVPVAPERDGPSLPFVFDIAVGVRRNDRRLQKRLDAILAARAGEIDALLDSYGVPRLQRPNETTAPH